MPYRLDPKNRRRLQVFKNGAWRNYRSYKSVAAAERALARYKRKYRSER